MQEVIGSNPICSTKFTDETTESFRFVVFFVPA